jgi:hypothetical protein
MEGTAAARRPTMDSRTQSFEQVHDTTSRIESRKLSTPTGDAPGVDEGSAANRATRERTKSPYPAKPQQWLVASPKKFIFCRIAVRYSPVKRFDMTGMHSYNPSGNLATHFFRFGA